MTIESDFLKIGFDTVLISRIAQSINRFGDSFIDRLFTQSERAYCDAAKGRVRVSRYAVRYAAKEAFVKAWDLFYWNQEPPLTGICFSSLEVVLDGWGRPELRLLGEVGALFNKLGFLIETVSLSHDQTSACAVVGVSRKKKSTSL